MSLSVRFDVAKAVREAKEAFESFGLDRFLSTPKAEMKPIATPSWQRAMQEAAETMPDRLARELTDRLEHMARKGR